MFIISEFLRGSVTRILLLSSKDLLDQVKVSGKLPTYPSPKPRLSLTSHLGQNREILLYGPVQENPISLEKAP